MQISVNTVSFHLKNIDGKLRVHPKTEAVAKALRDRIVRVDGPFSCIPLLRRDRVPGVKRIASLF